MHFKIVVRKFYLIILFFLLLPEKSTSKYRCMTEPANGVVYIHSSYIHYFFFSIHETTM